MTGECWPADRRAGQLVALRAAVAGRYGWQVLNLSAYTAHAVFRIGRTYGVVVGTASGWWWGVQHGTRQIRDMERAADVRQAYLLAQRFACRTHYRIARERVADGTNVAVGVRNGGRGRRRAAGSGAGAVRYPAVAAGPGGGSGSARRTGERGAPLVA